LESQDDSETKYECKQMVRGSGIEPLLMEYSSKRNPHQQIHKIHLRKYLSERWNDTRMFDTSTRGKGEIVIREAQRWNVRAIHV